MATAQICPVIGSTTYVQSLARVQVIILTDLRTVLPPNHPSYDAADSSLVCPVTKATSGHQSVLRQPATQPKTSSANNTCSQQKLNPQPPLRPLQPRSQRRNPMPRTEERKQLKQRRRGNLPNRRLGVRCSPTGPPESSPGGEGSRVPSHGSQP